MFLPSFFIISYLFFQVMEVSYLVDQQQVLEVDSQRPECTWREKRYILVSASVSFLQSTLVDVHLAAKEPDISLPSHVEEVWEAVARRLAGLSSRETREGASLVISSCR